jgi:hypothetical protein
MTRMGGKMEDSTRLGEVVDRRLLCAFIAGGVEDE